jgi:hypothetical protein
MITVKPFNLEVLSTHKGFFLLDKLPKHATEVDVWVQTPTGNESVDFVDIFSMADGSLLAAWKHPFQRIHNLQVFCEGIVQVLNLYIVERVIDVYDKPSDSEYGTFIFCSSLPIEGADWRCDQSMYGPRPFKGEQVSQVINSLDEIVFYESFLNVNGAGHIIYIETRTKTEFANEKLNNSVVPVTGRTLQECLRLVYEWSVLADEPFNSTDDAAVSASKFIKSLKLTQDEVHAIEALPQMQVSKFISGSETARLRDMEIPELSDDIADIVFRRIGASTLSFIVSKNPGIWDFDEIKNQETLQMELGIQRFREYYKLPDDMDIEDDKNVLEHAFIYFEKQHSYVYTQLRNFRNKKKVLLSLTQGNETEV